MNATDKEKLSWAEDLLKDWSLPHAHEAAYEYLAYTALNHDDEEVRAEARVLLTWAADNGVA
jgi:hypothetical protein